MGTVAASLATMGTGQTLLVFIFVGGYASALGPFAGSRARLVMTLVAIFAGAGFVVLSDPWETGVILLAFVPVGMGVFAVAAWLLWAVVGESVHQAELAAPVPMRPVPRQPRQLSSRPESSNAIS
jgi:hypothetical protein